MAFEQIKSDTNRDGFCFDTLLRLLKDGPLDAGDVPSKSGLHDLIEHGCAVTVIAKGEHAYAATHAGGDLFKTHMGTNTLKEALDLQKARFLEGWKQRNPEAAARGESPFA
ncbi:hypothetical protein [Burkholderia phage FLC9]|nr:hypothetical protein [Burkholderia phage FLC9]